MFSWLNVTRFSTNCAPGIVLGDGAIGTALFSRGAPLSSCIERLNIVSPDMVETLHRDYIKAGSRVIETNTFGANRLNLERYGLADRIVKSSKMA
jgi:homocysteine S-methyltransferase